MLISRYDIENQDTGVRNDVMWYIEIIWISSSVVSSFLFIVNFVIVAWIRIGMFTKCASIAVTVIMLLAFLCILFFCIKIYNKINRDNKLRFTKYYCYSKKHVMISVI